MIRTTSGLSDVVGSMTWFGWMKIDEFDDESESGLPMRGEALATNCNCLELFNCSCLGH